MDDTAYLKSERWRLENDLSLTHLITEEPSSSGSVSNEMHLVVRGLRPTSDWIT